MPITEYMIVTLAWQMKSDRVNIFGSRISDAMEKKPGVPEKAKTNEDTAAMASGQLGLFTTFQSDVQGPVCGAAEGRSSRPTAMARVMT